MDSEIWLEKAERLRSQLARLNSALLDGLEDSADERENFERVTIARWLREEFRGDSPKDTATLALFPEADRR